MHSRVVLLAALMLASTQVGVTQEEPNAAAVKALHAAYCIGVLTADIRVTQQLLNSPKATDRTREVLRSRLRQFQEFKDRYQTYGVPRLHEPMSAQMDAERARGEQDVITIAHMSETCAAKCPKLGDSQSGACYSACFAPARPMVEDFEVCQHGE